MTISVRMNYYSCRKYYLHSAYSARKGKVLVLLPLLGTQTLPFLLQQLQELPSGVCFPRSTAIIISKRMPKRRSETIAIHGKDQSGYVKLVPTACLDSLDRGKCSASVKIQGSGSIDALMRSLFACTNMPHVAMVMRLRAFPVLTFVMDLGSWSADLLLGWHLLNSDCNSSIAQVQTAAMNHVDARMEHSAKEPNDPCVGCRGFSRTLSSFHSGDIQAGNMIEGTLEV